MIAEITIDRDTYGLELTSPIVIDVTLGGNIPATTQAKSFIWPELVEGRNVVTHNLGRSVAFASFIINGQNQNFDWWPYDSETDSNATENFIVYNYSGETLINTRINVIGI